MLGRLIHRIGLVFAICLMLCVAVARSQDIEVTASVDKQMVSVGDVFRYSVIIDYDSTLNVIPPSVGSNLGQFDIKEYHVGEEERLQGGLRRQLLWFDMRSFRTGRFSIPPLPVEYITADSTQKIISSDSLSITVQSVLADSEMVDTVSIKNLKEQATLDSGMPLWSRLLLVGLGLGVIGFGIWWWTRKQIKEEVEFVDPRPSWEIAFADLALLKEKNYIAAGKLKLFYFELTEIIRRYLGKKFEFEAIDLTTTEIQEYFDAIDFDRGFQDELITFLKQADLVKFAKFVPPPEQPGLDWQTAYELVTKSKDMPVIKLVEIPVAQYIPSIRTEADSIEDDEWKYAPPGYKELMAARSGESGLSESAGGEGGQ